MARGRNSWPLPVGRGFAAALEWAGGRDEVRPGVYVETGPGHPAVRVRAALVGCDSCEGHRSGRAAGTKRSQFEEVQCYVEASPEFSFSRWRAPSRSALN